MVETTNGGGALHAAIAHLESAERQLSQHLAATRQALVSLRSVSGTEVAPLPKPERKAKPTAKANGRGFVSDEAVRAALKDGPSSPSDLAERLSLSRYQLKVALKALTARGIVTAAGSTNNRRVALPGTPGKEAHR